MKPLTLGLIIGLLAGIIIGILIIYLAAPKLMFKETRSSLSFEETTRKLEELALTSGWKLPAVHDLQGTLKKFGKDVSSVKIFELCQPEYAYEILSRDEEMIVSNMLPCRVAVYEKKDGTVWISRMKMNTMAKPMSPVVRKTMARAAGEVEKVIADVTGE
jgi:uncharacterized protein (DUF302 family)